MVVIGAGSFVMGSPDTEKGRDKDEGPQHRVTLSKAFAIGKLEVTRDQFAIFVGETGRAMGNACLTFEDKKWKKRSGRTWRSPGFPQDGTHPVVCVDWHDAKAYVAWLAKKTGKPYRLPTEAEWEYATRGGTQTRYFFGDDENKRCAYVRSPGCKQAQQSGTIPAGKLSPNPFGLYDTSGSVWEWVEDCANPNYKGAPSNGAAWTKGNCQERMMRGASFLDIAKNFRSANRFANPANSRDSVNGIRVLRGLTP